MTTESPQLEVGRHRRLCRHASLPLSCLAAFLTQSVNLDDGTTIRFEIWYV